MSEFRPPSIAPQGNVGTSTQYFLNAIKDCRLSPKVISKLGLDFLERRKRAFSAVPPPKNVSDGSSSKEKKNKEKVLCTNLPFERKKKKKIDMSSPSQDPTVKLSAEEPNTR